MITISTSTAAMNSVRQTSSIEARTKVVVSNGMSWTSPGGKSAARRSMVALTAGRDVERVGFGQLKDREAGRGRAVRA